MATNHFAHVDEQKFQAFHWRAVLTTGLGVFCDGYDISCIGLVLAEALHTFGVEKMTGIQSGALAASALVGSMFGSLIFGAMAQNGRKKFYGLTVLILGIAALAQGFSTSLTMLIAFRFILGIGVGADYVLSPVIMAEHSNRADRGKALGLGFGTMWPIGALTAAVFKLGLDAFNVPSDIQWRVVLAAGAIPAFGVLYLRRTMPESARFLARMAADQAQAHDVMKEVGGEAAPPPPPRDDRPFCQVLNAHMPHILGAAWLWLVYDLVVYSAILFGPNLIAKGLGLSAAHFQILNEAIFIIPASVLMSLFLIDRIGRKPLQVWGFLTSAVVMAIYVWMKGQPGIPLMIMFAVYGVFNITMTGPGLVSGAGVFGVELAPTRVRAVAQAITVCGGRIGAAISAFVFPLMFGAIGEMWAMAVLGVLSLVGGVCTWLMVPETGSRSLEDISGEFSAEAVVD